MNAFTRTMKHPIISFKEHYGFKLKSFELHEMKTGALGFSDASKLLGRYGIQTEGKLARTSKEAMKIAKEYGGPVAMKVISSDKELLHKTEMQAVVLNVEPDVAARKFRSLAHKFRENNVESILVQPMVSGVEILVGSTRNPTFGEVVTVGIGGVVVEVLKDVVHGVSEVTHEDALDMISRINHQELLNGFRGYPPIDRDELARIIVAVSKMMRENQDLKEMDLNPVIWGKDNKFHIVDPRLIRGEVTPAVRREPELEWKEESLEHILNPKTACALIGASTKERSVPDTAVKNMLKRVKENIDVHLVNPKFEEGLEIKLNPSLADICKILDKNGIVHNSIDKEAETIKKTLELLGVGRNDVPYELRLAMLMRGIGKTNRIILHNDTANLPKDVDLGIFMTPSEAAPKELEKFAKLGGKGAVVLTDGFKESGRSDLQDELIRIEKQYKMGIVGPNCLGIINPNINTNFIPGERTLDLGGTEKSKIAVVAQSGGNALEIKEKLGVDGVAVNTWISCGNAASIGITDYLKRLGKDDSIEVIALYLESIPNGIEFYETLKEVCKHKAVMVMKGGRSEKGAQATASHTGNITKDADILEDACRQAGAYVVNDIKVASNVLSLLATQKPPENMNVAIVTIGGGIGIVLTDKCCEAGLNQPEFTPELVERLSKVKGLEKAHLANPLDILGSANDERLLEVLRILNDDPNVGVIYLALYPQVPGLSRELFEKLGELNREMKKPLVISPRGDGPYIRYCKRKLSHVGVPTYTIPVVVPLLFFMEISRDYPGVEFRSAA